MTVLTKSERIFIVLSSITIRLVARTEKDKQRLSNLMAYGEDITPPNSESLRLARQQMWRKQREKLDQAETDRFEECKFYARPHERGHAVCDTIFYIECILPSTTHPLKCKESSFSTMYFLIY